MAAQQPVDIHASRSDQILVVIIVFSILATITILLRVYTRFVLLKTPAIDDAFALLALIFCIGMCICQGLEVKNGMGKHVITLTKKELAACFKALYASVILYNLGLTSVKLSILLLYLRICVTRMSKRVCYAILVFIVAYGIETFLTGVFVCTPVAYFWNSKIPGGKCINRTKLYFSNAGINIVTDFALLLLPAIVLRHLMMQRPQKLVLMVILAFGSFACIASILRLHALYISTKSTDPTWDKTGVVYWSAVELNVGIMCSSMPTLRPLGSKLFPRVFGSSSHVSRPSYALRSGAVKITVSRKGDISTSKIDLRKDIEEVSLKKDIELG